MSLKRLITAVVAFMIFAAAGCGKVKDAGDTAKTEETPKPTANTAPIGETALGWDNIYDGFDEVWDFADEIFIGRVRSHEYYERDGLPYTAVTVTIETPVKGGETGKTRIISYSGGELEGELYTSTSVVVPTDGEEYLFLIEPELEGDEYRYPCGGFQGTYKVSGESEDSVIEKFNGNNVLESEIIGEPITQLPY